MGMGPMDVGSDLQEQLRSSLEWHRWQEADKRAWQEEKRQRWAEQLWAVQIRRRYEQRRFKQRLDAYRALGQEQLRREAQRQKRYSNANDSDRFGGAQSFGKWAGGGRGDPLGFYAQLGVEKECSLDDIKGAFRRAALKLHPDTLQQSGDDQGEQWVKLVAAYEVLRDETKRREYDRS
jgi:hypothetical protein